MNQQKAQAVKRRGRSAQRFYYRQTIVAIATIAIIILCNIVFGEVLSSEAHGNTHEDPVNYTYYKSVEIKAGDSLWSIAEEYITEEYTSVNQYIEVLKRINSLESNAIHEGQYIMVAYNDQEFK